MVFMVNFAQELFCEKIVTNFMENIPARFRTVDKMLWIGLGC